MGIGPSQSPYRHKIILPYNKLVYACTEWDSNPHAGVRRIEDIVDRRPVARQRPRNKQLYDSGC
jgi:hypothetical protein